ncbi:unnamed protein product [Oikopleura dioica]|nr:unnamed protein product [Oikopleura dioica]
MTKRSIPPEVTKKILRRGARKASHFEGRNARIQLFGWKSLRSKKLRHMQRPLLEKL